MFNTYSEYAHEHKYGDQVGTIEVNTTYVTRRKPAWLVLLKLLGLALMVAVAVGIAYPSLRQVLPPLQSVAIIAGVILIYAGLAFFFKPEACVENLGFHGGVYDDPFKVSDNINRGLMDLNFYLGPGRFASETLLDTCVLLGLAGGEEVLPDQEPVPEPEAEPMKLQIVTLKRDRFEE
jgi:hypothetical protein